MEKNNTKKGKHRLVGRIKSKILKKPENKIKHSNKTGPKSVKKNSVKKAEKKIESSKKKEEVKSAEKKKISDGAEDEELFQILSPFYKIELKVKKTMDEGGKDYNCILLVENLKEYSNINLALLKYFQSQKIPGIFVTVNKPVQDIIKTAKKNNIEIENVKFIDAITLQSGNITTNQQVEYIESPKDLVELITIIEEEIDGMTEKFFLVFDSVSTMLVYNKKQSVEKFIHSLSGKIKSSECQGIIVAVESTEEETLHALAQFCDATIKV